MSTIRLGDYDNSIPPKVTPLGITYYAYGLDDFGKNRVRKACVKMRNAGVEEWIINQFQPWALALPTELPQWIDDAYQARMSDWRKCAGSRLPNGRMINETRLAMIEPRQLKIILHPEPWAPSGRSDVMTAGAAYRDRIEVVIAALSNGNTWLRKCDDLIAWECGNWIAYQFDYAPQVIEGEIGNKCPC